jgi:hypothetical protein
MKKLVVVCIMLVFLVVGFSGCQDVGLGITNIGDITANPVDYYGKEVTVEGTCAGVGEYGYVADDKGHSIGYKYHTSLNGMYRLTGMVLKNQQNLSLYYLDVSKVKAI